MYLEWMAPNGTVHGFIMKIGEEYVTQSLPTAGWTQGLNMTVASGFSSIVDRPVHMCI